MPGNVAAAVAVGVFPGGLCAAFQRMRTWPANINQYANGEVQAGKLATTFRNRWSISKRLPASSMETLRLFYVAAKGAHIAFYFYDQEVGPYDATGVATTGRFLVRFEGPFTAAFGTGRHTVPLQLVEVA